MASPSYDVLIVGAGMAGLSAAEALAQADLTCLLLDKGRRVGGRMATRVLGEGAAADHGAQFFSARSADFQAQVSAWQAAGVIKVWSHGWSSGSSDPTPPDGHPRYAAPGGMNQLPQHMAAWLAGRAEIITSAHVQALYRRAEGWRAVYSTHAQPGAAEEVLAQAVIMTPPVPQSLTLLAAGDVPLTPGDQAALARISYGPCLCGLFVLSQPLDLPPPGALQRPDHPFSWIADNLRKGISPQAYVITIHAAPGWSRDHYTAEEAVILAAMQAELEQHSPIPLQVQAAQLMRWRYAIPEVLHDAPCLLAQNLPPLIFAGDAFAGLRVEGAFLSGRAAAAALLDRWG